MKALMQPLEAVAGFDDLKRSLKKNRGVIEVTGAIESEKAHFAAGLAENCGKVLLITENELRARELFEDYRLYDREVLLYPARDMVFSDADLSGNLITQQRMKVIKALSEREHVSVVTSTGGCMDRLLPFRVLKNHCVDLRTGGTADTDRLAHRLADLGYERMGEADAPGQFAVRGGIIDIFSLTEDLPWRIELWGDEIDSIRSYDPESQRSIENLDGIRIYPASEGPFEGEDAGKALTDTLPDYFPEGSPVFLFEPSRIAEAAEALSKEYHEAVVHRIEKGKGGGTDGQRMLTPQEFYYNLNRRCCVGLSVMRIAAGDYEIADRLSLEVRSVSSYNNQFPLLVKDLKKWQKNGYRAVLLSASHTRAKRLAGELSAEGLSAFYSEDESRVLSPGEIMVMYGSARKGFEYPMQRFVVITESDIFGRVRKKRKKKKNPNAVHSFDELSIGDYVIHEGHGLGIYRGIEKVETDGTVRDFIRIEYAGGSSLYVPATQLDLLQKYGSADGKRPHVNKLGGAEWGRTKKRVRGAVKDIADDLVRLYAVREQSQGYKYGPDTVWQQEFEEMFPYEETEDQLQAIEDTKHDMESGKIMDRLICGDVGFGKTEVAIRAAFKAVQEGKQVVLLAPTTILAQQHYNTFVQRMKDFPVRIDLMCRFRTAAQMKKTTEDLKKGLVDIVVGTHRVLSKDVKFKDLGLLIIDEEQRFGVAHKEKIKQMKKNVDVLSLTATPIPRTLHMSMIGIRDMSVLEEAPLDRVPIQTYVMEQDDEIVREAVSRELARGGQVYYVYNRVNDIQEAAARISRLVPEARVAYAHGRMNERELERIMVDFVDGEIDVLVSTTIIETGLDIPNVNTIIIHDAERMGLSQLYQLRGRVGRSNRTAYAFLLYRRNRMLKEEAEKRLHAIREFTELGSGVRIAMRDLEIRGAGNLLGAEQSGHMEAVGYDLYCKMLREAVSEAKGDAAEEEFETGVDLVIDAFIPDSYIPDEAQKLDIYKRISAILNGEDADNMIDELLDRYGDPPKSVTNLIDIAKLRAEAHRVYISEIRETPLEIRFTLYPKARLDVSGFQELLAPYRGEMEFHAVGKPCFTWRKRRAHMSAQETMKLCTGFVEELEKLAP
jgi:transcription-repair coupling factor (superfamily II helicase)